MAQLDISNWDESQIQSKIKLAKLQITITQQ